METSPAAPSWIIVGLGNPGRFATDKRTNVGLLAVDALAGASPFDRAGLSLVRRAELGGVPILLAKPLAYMDRCGEAVHSLVVAYHVAPSHVVVLHDDPLLPVGFLRVRTRGSHAGHKGMKAVTKALHSGPGRSEIPHVRIGTGVEGVAGNLCDDFTDSERGRLPTIFAAVAGAVTLMVQGQSDKAMSLFNRRDAPVDRIALPKAVGNA